MKNIILKELHQAQRSLYEFIHDVKRIDAIEQAAIKLIECLQNGGKIVTCGNGGSMGDAMHFASELTGRYRNNRKPIAAISISDPSHISCVANDYGYQFVFRNYFQAIAKPNDVLVCFSTSGNSQNVVIAAEWAKANGYKVIGITGKDGGSLKNYLDVEIRAPHSEYADRAQEISIKVVHVLCNLIENNSLVI